MKKKKKKKKVKHKETDTPLIYKVPLKKIGKKQQIALQHKQTDISQYFELVSGHGNETFSTHLKLLH